MAHDCRREDARFARAQRPLYGRAAMHRCCETARIRRKVSLRICRRCKDIGIPVRDCPQTWLAGRLDCDLSEAQARAKRERGSAKHQAAKRERGSAKHQTMPAALMKALPVHSSANISL